MALRVSYWERRDASNRDALGYAALSYCRTLRSVNGVRDVRFYWQTPDTVVTVEDVESLDGLQATLSGALSSEQSQALFALSDCARQTRREQWQDARVSELLYRRSADRYQGEAEISSLQGQERLPVQADLWGVEKAGEAAWGGELRALRPLPTESPLVLRGALLQLALPSGAHGECRIEKVRPERLRIEGIGAAPFHQ